MKTKDISNSTYTKKSISVTVYLKSTYRSLKKSKMFNL